MPLGYFDDGLLHHDEPAEEVYVPGPKCYQFTPAQSGLDRRQHQRLIPRRDLGQKSVEVLGRVGIDRDRRVMMADTARQCVIR